MFNGEEQNKNFIHDLLNMKCKVDILQFIEQYFITSSNFPLYVSIDNGILQIDYKNSKVKDVIISFTLDLENKDLIKYKYIIENGDR